MQHLRTLPLPLPPLGLKYLAIGLSLTPFLLTIFPPSRPKPKFPPLPEGIERIFIGAGDRNGELEVLVAYPPSSNPTSNSKSPILFIHGGYGSAWCWIKWLPYFAREEGRVVYAVSLSGHGLSTRPWFFHLRSKSYFVKDVQAILAHISSKQHSAPPIIVGHSAGGGISQYVLDQYGTQLRAEDKVGGLVCVSPFPPTGGIPVYVNWIGLDPTLFLRMVGGDAYTVLSTPRRVSRAFFGIAYARSLYGNTSQEKKAHDTVPEGFMEQMNKEESIVWPSGMMLPFVNTQRVIRNLTFGSPNSNKETIRIGLIAGSRDALMTPSVMGSIQRSYGCSLEFVQGAGHHMMHDVQWEEGARLVERLLSNWGV